MSGKLLITGATGFIGAAVACQFEQRGWRVRTTGRAYEPPLELSDYQSAELLNQVSLAPLLQDVNYVVHAAGLAHQFGKHARNADAFHAANVGVTENVVRGATEAGVKHFVLISSVSVYGSAGDWACTEEQPCRPRGPYAESKYLAEQRAIELARTAGMKLTILRIATVYGEGDPGNVARLTRTIDRNRFVWLGRGKNLKSLIHRDDVARACCAVLESEPNGQDVEIYNVSAPPCTMREVVTGLAAALGKRPPRWSVPVGPLLHSAALASLVFGEQGRIGRFGSTLEKWIADDVYDASKFNRTFGFRTEVPLAEGLKREVAWYRSNAQDNNRQVLANTGV